MEPKIVDLISGRLDRIEDKLDALVSFRFYVIGGAAAASLVFSFMFQIALFLFEKH